MVPEPFESSAGTIEATNKAAPGGKPLPAPPCPPEAAKATPLQFALVALGAVAFLYFARPVVLPIVLACVGGMTLKPLIRWLSQCHIPPALSAAVVLLLLVAGMTIGFIRIGHPALTWLSEAPQHMTELKQKGQKTVPPCRAIQPGSGRRQQPGSDGGGTKESACRRAKGQPRSHHH